MPVCEVRGKWALSVRHNVTFCLLNQSCHQSKRRDGIKNGFGMTGRIWESNTEAARAGQSQGHPLGQDKPSPSLNLLLLVSASGCQERGGDPL